MDAAIDPAALRERIASLNVLLRSHAGEIELVDVSRDGTVTVRYTGMCAGCDYRPVTMAGTVEPALLDVAGVKQVRALGSRVSEEAMTRIEDTLQDSDSKARAVRLVRRIESEKQEGMHS